MNKNPSSAKAAKPGRLKRLVSALVSIGTSRHPDNPAEEVPFDPPLRRDFRVERPVPPQDYFPSAPPGSPPVPKKSYFTYYKLGGIEIDPKDLKRGLSGWRYGELHIYDGHHWVTIADYQARHGLNASRKVRPEREYRY